MKGSTELAQTTGLSPTICFTRAILDEMGVTKTWQKIDNSDVHDGEIHLDKLYREDDAEVKDYEIDVESWAEAGGYIEERWRKFADLHYEKHGE
jgi:hypothetical protein